MSDIKDGGSAFPQVISDYDDSTHKYMNVHSVGGMTLRDYFAAKAMLGLMTEPQWDKSESMLDLLVYKSDNFELSIALSAYKLADAMLKARG